MPSLDPTQVRVAGSGSIWKAPLGTPLPTDSISAWNAAFANLGLATDGFIMGQDLKQIEIPAWQTLEIARLIDTALHRKFGFELLQTNKNTLAAALGGATITPVGATSLGSVIIAITTGILTVSVPETLAIGNPVQLTGVVGAAPFVSGLTYYVQSIPTSTTLTLALTAGGAAIVTSAAGTATGISQMLGAYSLAIPNAVALADFMLGIDWSDGATSMRFIIPRAHFLTLPAPKFGRLDAIRYAFEIQALAPADSSNSVQMFGLDGAVGV
jgi:hypothetical protein